MSAKCKTSPATGFKPATTLFVNERSLSHLAKLANL